MEDGARLASYVIVRSLGSGAQGDVWEGRHTTTGERVALKRMLSASSANVEAARRFRREATLLRRVTSERVARIVDVIEDPREGTILVTELIDGALLRDVLESTYLDVEDVVDLGIGLLAAVADVHASGVVHRDLKPSNVILRHREDGQVDPVLLDFGLARALLLDGDESSLSQITKTNMAVGSLHYMAPEQLLDARTASPRSDLYAVAAILYYAAIGRHPFGDDEAVVGRKKLMFEAPPPAFGDGSESDGGALDPAKNAFVAVVQRGLRRHAQERFETAREMMTALASIKLNDGGKNPFQRPVKPKQAFSLKTIGRTTAAAAGAIFIAAIILLVSAMDACR